MDSINGIRPTNFVDLLNDPKMVDCFKVVTNSVANLRETSPSSGRWRRGPWDYFIEKNEFDYNSFKTHFLAIVSKNSSLSRTNRDYVKMIIFNTIVKFHKSYPENYNLYTNKNVETQEC